MTWADVEQDVWTIPAEKTKNGKAHVVDLSSSAMEIVEGQPKLGPFVFSSSGERPVNGWSRAKQRLDAAMANMPAWRIHDLRRTAASGMAELGTPPHVTERVLNHVSGSIGGLTGVYQRHTYREDRKAALIGWGRRVAQIISVAESNVVPLKKT
jgi:integrase